MDESFTQMDVEAMLAAKHDLDDVDLPLDLDENARDLLRAMEQYYAERSTELLRESHQHEVGRGELSTSVSHITESAVCDGSKRVCRELLALSDPQALNVEDK